MSAPAVFVDGAGLEVSAVLIGTAEDITAVRADEGWHDGQVRVLTYPTALIMFVGLGNDVGLTGREVLPGQWLVKGPAGDIEPMPAEMFEARFSAVSS